jgi:hypothetical protein
VFACVSLADAAEMTRQALFFASTAKRVQLQPKVNEVVNSKALLRKMQAEIALLRRQLVRGHLPHEDPANVCQIGSECHVVHAKYGRV